MVSSYYKPCEELSIALTFDKHWENKEYEKFFEGYFELAQRTSYALAECQVGYCYLEGIGTKKDLTQALYWTQRSAEHGNRDGQANLAWIYEEGLCGEIDLEKAKYWYQQAALQDHDEAIKKCEAYGVMID